MRHGGDPGDSGLARDGVGPPWLDLSTGINPHPWPVPDSLRELGWTTLPSRADRERLLTAARAAYGVPDDLGIVAAPGTQALIQWLPRLAPAGTLAVLGPTYGEHAAAWRLAGREVVEIASLDDLPGDARHLALVNPNNPDGRVLSAATIVAAAETSARRGGWLVLDESFADACPDASLVGRSADLPVIVLRSFGKFYGLAGLRLGFAIAPHAVASVVERALGPWAVSGPALAVGAAALADHAWATAMRARLVHEAAALDGVLAGAGLAPAGGSSLYRLVRRHGAGAIHASLAEQRIWVRRFAWSDELLRFGLPPDVADLGRLRAGLATAGAVPILG